MHQTNIPLPEEEINPAGRAALNNIPMDNKKGAFQKATAKLSSFGNALYNLTKNKMENKKLKTFVILVGVALLGVIAATIYDAANDISDVNDPLNLVQYTPEQERELNRNSADWQTLQRKIDNAYMAIQQWQTAQKELNQRNQEIHKSVRENVKQKTSSILPTAEAAIVEVVALPEPVVQIASSTEFSAPKPTCQIFMKNKVGEDIQAKIKRLNEVMCEKGFTDDQRKWVLGLADHESGGTWSETVKGDNGCSTGIGQWNACPGSGRIAPPTFEEQVQLLTDEFKDKFSKHPIETAIGKHNAPAWDSNPRYVNRVRKSVALFN